MKTAYLILLSFLVQTVCSFSSAVAEPLPSWNSNKTKRTLVEFVESTTTPGSKKFLEPSDRIAVFDNDGTLWAEQPVYFQALFIFDRIKQLAPKHPEWKTEEPFASVLRDDYKSALAGGKESLLKMTMATHAGLTTEDFHGIVKQWIDSAKHPKTSRPYTEMIYKPMLELLEYLRDNGFKTFIVSGGGIEFMRPWVEKVYGIPPEQVIGSSIETKYEVKNGTPSLVRLAELNFIDDKAGKPVGINQHIGRRPVLAFGNSDGDFEMLEWTTAGKGPRLGVLIHHTDSKREWAYDRKSHIGKLERGLDEAKTRNWLIVDMKRDWEEVFLPDNG